MASRRFVLAAFLAALGAAGQAGADTLIVDAGGGGDFLAIQPALDAAVSGDTVLVVAGTYAGATNRNLTFAGKDLALRSVSGAAATVIDAESGGRAFVLTAGEGPAAQIEGFTLRRGAGGAVFCQNSSPSFKDCVLVENASDQFGGAVTVQGGMPSFEGCTVVGNSAANRGGGFWIGGGANVGIASTTITGNDGGLDGGGILVTGGGQLTLQRTILWGNRSGGTFDDLAVAVGATAGVTCSVVDASGAGGGGVINVGAGVLDRDPHFCQPAHCREEPWADGDYGLAANSPCLPANNTCGQLIGAWPQACDNVVVWTGAAGTTAWENPGNWSTFAVPGHDDNVQITTGDVVLASTAEIGWLTQCAESDAPQLTFTIAPGGHLRLGYVTDPAKEIQVATVTSDKTVIENGGDASTGGTAPHLWELLGWLDLKGGRLDGNLDVTNRGTLTCHGGGIGADVTITNAGGGAKSRAAGTLEIAGGSVDVDGRVVNDAQLNIADGAVLRLDGQLDNGLAGAVALRGDVTGVGRLVNLGAIEKSGPAPSDVAVMVDNGPGGTIAVSENAWRVGGPFASTGLVTVASGATLTRNGLVENGAGGVVVLTGGISGGGLLANAGLVQRVGPGTSNVSGVLRNTFDQTTGDRGRLVVSGGVLAVTGLENHGTTTVAGGATLVASGQLTNGGHGRLAGGGTINASAAVFSNQGEVSPGQSPGTLTVQGNYPTTSSSRLVIELGGTVPGLQHDRLAVTGSAVMGGELHVSLIDGYLPAPGDSFRVLTVGPGGWLPDFACYSGLQLGPDLILEPVVRPNGLVLVAVATGVLNQPPVAVADTVDVAPDLPATLLPLANDADPEGDDLTLVRLITTATAGRAFIALDGETITYLPPDDPAGVDSLVYVVTDCAGATASATVVIRRGGVTQTPPPDATLAAYTLHANAPNPFNPVTRIRFDLPRSGPARVAVFDLRGRLVQVLAEGHHAAGSYTVDWFGRDERGGAVAAGVYVARLEAPGHVSSRKMVLVR